MAWAGQKSFKRFNLIFLKSRFQVKVELLSWEKTLLAGGKFEDFETHFLIK
jgi:hypothetical protein